MSTRVEAVDGGAMPAMGAARAGCLREGAKSYVAPLRRHPKGAAVGSRLRPVRTTGSPSAGSLWTRGPAPSGRRGAGRCGRWRTETAVPDGAADLVADLYRRMPAARPGELLAHVSCPTDKTTTSSSGSQPLPDCLAPLGWEHINLNGGNTAGRAPTPSGTAKRLP